MDLTILNEAASPIPLHAYAACPSSDDMGPEELISKGGSGSLRFQFMPRSGDSASGVYGWFWL